MVKKSSQREKDASTSKGRSRAKSRKKGSNSTISKGKVYSTSTSEKGFVFGDQKFKLNRMRFEKYVENLEDASRFLRHDGSVMFYQNLSIKQKHAVRLRLGKVDPEGLKEMDRRIRTRNREIKKRKALVVSPEEVKEDVVAVTLVQDEEQTGADLIKFMDLKGIKFLLAVCIASGYSRPKTAELVGMDVTDMNQLVTEDDVRAAKKAVPNAIEMAADKIVLDDLMEGAAFESTNRADLISTRRKKLKLDALNKIKEIEEEKDDVPTEKVEQSIRERFGVDRKEGKVVDVEVEEEK